MDLLWRTLVPVTANVGDLLLGSSVAFKVSVSYSLGRVRSTATSSHHPVSVSSIVEMVALPRMGWLRMPFP
jgi:hypothetical protein